MQTRARCGPAAAEFLAQLVEPGLLATRERVDAVGADLVEQAVELELVDGGVCRLWCGPRPGDHGRAAAAGATALRLLAGGRAHETRDELQLVEHAVLPRGDHADEDGPELDEQGTEEPVAQVLQHVEQHEHGGEHPQRDVEEPHRVRAVEGVDDQQRDGEDAQAVGLPGVGGEVEERHHGCRQHRHQGDHDGEAHAADGVFDAMPHKPEERQGEDDPDACGRVGDRPGDQPPDLTLAHQRRDEVHVEDGPIGTADGVEEHRQHAEADEQCRGGDIDRADAEPAIATRAFGHRELVAAGHARNPIRAHRVDRGCAP